MFAFKIGIAFIIKYESLSVEDEKDISPEELEQKCTNQCELSNQPASVV